MILGTGSECGKSMIAAAFCRLLRHRHLRVAPFKAQNMALNSGVTPEGKEMGRAQIVQAECAGIEPHVDMNPVLLKPTSEMGSQVIVHGAVTGTMDAAASHGHKRSLWPQVTASYDRLASQYAAIVLEGAGSPVEVNLKKHDIVNMAMAEYADARVLLVADIDRGGVFASIVGTVDLLEPAERKRLIGFVINKFRGDVRLLDDGLRFIEQRTGYPVLGVFPYLRDLYLPGEDSLSLDTRARSCTCQSAVCVGVVRLPHIANYTDFDPLECDPRFSVRYIETPRLLSGYDAIILPGSKNVFFDYGFLQASGFAARLMDYHGSGGRLMGICGGFQMLGESIRDPHGVESEEQIISALGLLPVSSTMHTQKVTRRAQHVVRLPGITGDVLVNGYEIHMGRTKITDPARAVLLSSNPEAGIDAGVASLDGRVWGTYLHGLFDNDALRDALLCWAGTLGTDAGAERFSYSGFKEAHYNRLADALQKHVDVERVLAALV